MNTSEGYNTLKGKGAECTKCGDWISPAEKCVMLEPGVVEESGSVSIQSKAIHGVLCMKCFKKI